MTTVVRPIRESDYETFEKFAMTAGAGVTSLPKQSGLLRKKLDRALASFNSTEPCDDGLYLFVLEDTSTGELGGTCAINAKTLGSEDGYVFRVEELIYPRTSLPTPKTVRILQPIQRKIYETEIGGLYLLPKYRKGGLGRLLSLSRFLFIASHPDRFQPTVIAEMRGRIENNMTCPFWDGIGRHFLKLPFNRMVAEVANNPALLTQIIPRFPIYVSLLPVATQRAIGKTHKNTTAALSMLEREGFKYTYEIGVFDGGPKIAAAKQAIRTVAMSQQAIVKELSILPFEGNRALICNERLDFRCSNCTVKELDGNNVRIHLDVGTVLQVKPGDQVRYISLPSNAES
jgi:arginine N-succinyltransferase